MELLKKITLPFFLFVFLSGCSPVQAAPEIKLKPPRVNSVTLTPYILPTSEAVEVFEPTTTATPGIEKEYQAEITLAVPSPSPTITLTPKAKYPDEFYIRGILGHKQYFKLGCEASVAKDWASYFGVELNEFEFQYRLPLSENPDEGFVGDVLGPWGQVPPYAYGVHAEPVAALLREYGLPAKGVKGFTLDQMREQLSQGKPVIAWVIGNVVGGIPYEYTDSEGKKSIVAAYEHVVIVTGYDKDSFRYNTNGRYYQIKDQYFLNSFKVLGNMVLYYDGEFDGTRNQFLETAEDLSGVQ